MQIAAAHADLSEILREILGHALRQCGYEHALATLGAQANFLKQVVDLALNGANLHFRVDQPRGANHLLHEATARFRQLVGAGRRRHI